MRKLIQTLLPDSARALATRLMTVRIQRNYKLLSLASTFNQIYLRGAWGAGDGGQLNSGIGSTGEYVEKYCALINPALRIHNVRSIVDLGCGNFNTGQKVAQMVSTYVGVDIAKSVIDANIAAHENENVKFLCADLTTDDLPNAEVAILRQVLQHLSNAEIREVLENVLHRYPLVLITEHIFTGRRSKANLDITHGPGTRVPMRSGVFVDKNPFNVAAEVLGDIHYRPNEVLRTWKITR